MNPHLQKLGLAGADKRRVHVLIRLQPVTGTDVVLSAKSADAGLQKIVLGTVLQQVVIERGCGNLGGGGIKLEN